MLLRMVEALKPQENKLERNYLGAIKLSPLTEQELLNLED